MLFGRSPRGLFPSFLFCFKDPRYDGDRFPQKIYIPSCPPPRGGNSEDIKVYIYRAIYIALYILSSHIARVMINGVRLSILLVVS